MLLDGVRLPSLLLPETKQWREAEALPVPGDAESDFQAGVYWTRPVAAGTSAMSRPSKMPSRTMMRLSTHFAKSDYSYVAKAMAADHDEAHAWLAFVHGDTQAAVKLLTAVADKQEREGKGEVELPASEMLADMLLAADQPAAALAAYEPRSRPQLFQRHGRSHSCRREGRRG